MRELADSTPIARDGERLRERVAQDGYVFFRRLLAPAPICGLARDALAALQREGWLEEDVAPELAALRPPARDFKNGNFFPGYAALQKISFPDMPPCRKSSTSMRCRTNRR